MSVIKYFSEYNVLNAHNIITIFNDNILDIRNTRVSLNNTYVERNIPEHL